MLSRSADSSMRLSSRGILGRNLSRHWRCSRLSGIRIRLRSMGIYRCNYASEGGTMKHALGVVMFCLTALVAFAQDPAGSLSSLPQAKDYVQHRSSSYDRSGG